MIATRLSSSKCAACSNASQTEPSAISLSPQSTQTRYGSRSSFLPASAMPTPNGSPCPSDPVATSTHGMTGVGCPSSSGRTCGSVRSSSSEIAPAARNIEYSRGDAWPFEKTSWSLCGSFGLSKS